MKKLTDYSKLNQKDISYKEYHEYFETDDGLIVALDKHKPGISKVLYYADEDWGTGEYRTASDIAPTKEDLKRCFIQDNLRKLHSYKRWLENHPTADLYITERVQYRGEESGARAIFAAFPDDLDDPRCKPLRKLTEEELKVVFAFEKEQEEQFIKRLERYWKRYADKVYISTYWANR